MVARLRRLTVDEARRRDAGRAEHSIPFSPDHDHLQIDDQTTTVLPGYSAIGRRKGLAELRGILTALAHPEVGGRA